MRADIARLKSHLSLNQLTGVQVRDLLRKMSVPCEVDKKDQNILNVEVPVTRSDIMHECDLVEDIAIAWGYNNLHVAVPTTFSGAAEQPINRISDILRLEMAAAGFTECLNWALISKRENFTQMRREENREELWRLAARPNELCSSAPAVSLLHPKTKEFEICRTSVLPGLLKTMAKNKQQPPPIRVFECGDVVIQEPTREVGSRNVRRIGALHTALTSQFSLMHGCLDQIMYSLAYEPAHEHDAKTSKRNTYKLVPSQDPAFFPGMQAHIVLSDGTIAGIIGELHPEVLSCKGFDVNLPTSAFELNIEPFLETL